MSYRLVISEKPSVAMLMEQKTEALYLINGDKFLHLRENGAGDRLCDL